MSAFSPAAEEGWQAAGPARGSGQPIRTGNMPTLKYQMAHPEANLTGQEALDLARGLDATLGTPRAPRS